MLGTFFPWNGFFPADSAVLLGNWPYPFPHHCLPDVPLCLSSNLGPQLSSLPLSLLPSCKSVNVKRYQRPWPESTWPTDPHLIYFQANWEPSEHIWVWEKGRNIVGMMSAFSPCYSSSGLWRSKEETEVNSLNCHKPPYVRGLSWWWLLLGFGKHPCVCAHTPVYLLVCLLVCKRFSFAFVLYWV